MKRQGWGLVFLLIAMLSGLACRLLWPRERLLLNLATRSSPMRLVWHISDYRWISNREAITWGGVNDKEFAWHRLTSTSDVLLDRLNKIYPQLDAFGGPGLEDLSPDGKYFVWTTRYAKGIPHTYSIASDGTQLHRWSTAYDAPHWMQDSRHWIAYELSYGTRETYIKSIALCDVKAPYAVKWLPVKGKPLWLDEAMGMSTVNVMDSILRSVVTTKKHLLLMNEMEELEAKRGYLDVLEIEVGNPVTPLHHYMIHQLWRSFESVDFSRQGDRVAWFCIEESSDGMLQPSVNPLPSLIDNPLPSYSVRSYRSMTLKICNLDGSHCREIGHFPPRLPDQNEDEAEDLQWTPDGKRISFIRHNTLWTVPAD